MVLVFHWEKKLVSFFFFGVQSFQDDLAIKVSFPNTKSVYKCFCWGGVDYKLHRCKVDLFLVLGY